VNSVVVLMERSPIPLGRHSIALGFIVHGPLDRALLILPQPLEMIGCRQELPYALRPLRELLHCSIWYSGYSKLGTETEKYNNQAKKAFPRSKIRGLQRNPFWDDPYQTEPRFTTSIDACMHGNQTIKVKVLRNEPISIYRIK
jgi:hypothetical protein